MGLTFSQQQAIAADGNVLLVAGAGTGKTRTLVERCLRCLLRENSQASINELLIVTFTDAAAAEMRHRLRVRLQAELATRPNDTHCQEQLALFETAHIGTLHSFCLQLIRQYFYALQIDPQVMVLREDEAAFLANEQLDRLFQLRYARADARAKAVQELVHHYGSGSDQLIRSLVLRIHLYSQTLADPANWFGQQLAYFSNPQPEVWRGWLTDGIAQWRRTWLPALANLAVSNRIAAQCHDILRDLPERPAADKATASFKRVLEVYDNCPRGQKREWLDPLERFIEETEFLTSLADDSSGDPLAQDWEWVRVPMQTLLELALDFGAAFAQTKQAQGNVDFHDLEQFALQLLWDRKDNKPTEIAQEWRRNLRYVFVDEYQDINEAQDKIIQALSRETSPRGNRFLVGDVKQSIYRFRLAKPQIFLRYQRRWAADPAGKAPAAPRDGTVIPLVENFRSREGILKFVNSLFAHVMQEEVGGIEYNEEARLRFGADDERREVTWAADPSPQVELHLRIKGGRNQAEADENAADALATLDNLEEADKEARLLGLRLIELRTRRHLVWDRTSFRPVQWADIAVLLRSPAAKAESYAKEFSKLGIPLEIARLGFYETREISDLLSLLQILDNPLQDLPALAVLRSPFVGLTINELASIRLARPGRFWTALIKWHQQNSKADRPPGATFQRVDQFLERYNRWRQLVRQTSVSRCLETVLAETHYAASLLAQKSGQQSYANVQLLVAQARQFDRFQRQSLFRFLRFVEARQEGEADAPAPRVGGKDVVRLLSIHQSKGLEFPVVALADLGKAFNLADLRGEIILDEEYGLCPMVKPPEGLRRYPSLPFWLARRRELRELLGEELRLLYVAMTRARDTLILSATIPESRFAKMWKKDATAMAMPIADARSYADWLGLWFAHHAAAPGLEPEQRPNALLKWFLHQDNELLSAATQSAQPQGQEQPFYEADPDAWEQVQTRLAWTYPYRRAAELSAKTTVSMIGRRYAEFEHEEAAELFATQSAQAAAAGKSLRRADARGAVDIGNVHHAFLQLVSLDATTSIDQLRAEAERMIANGNLSVEEVGILDFGSLARFWSSDIGTKIREQSRHVRRELAFTASFTEPDLFALIGGNGSPGLSDEFVVVQGSADLVVLLPEEIWLLDFKTDAMTGDDLDVKTRLYEPQLQLYAAALSRIYRRPVSACWIYFLTPGKAAQVSLAGAQLPSTADRG